MSILSIKRLVSLPVELEVSTLYITKNQANATLVDLTFVGDDISDIRTTLGQNDITSAVDAAIAALTAEQIPDLPGTKIITDLTVNTSGNAATADALKIGATINGVLFKGNAPITIPTVDTETPRVAVSEVGVSVAPLVDGMVPKQYIPASFDNIDSYATREEFPEEGRSDVIYIAQDTNFMYRWADSVTGYVQISSGGGVVDQANRLTVPREIAVEGDATGSVEFDGSENVSIPLTLASVGTAGEQSMIVSTDAKGRVISSRAALAGDIPDLPGSKIVTDINVNTSGNANTASKLAEPIMLTLEGDATGSVEFDGSTDITMTVTVASQGTTGATGTFTKVQVENGIVKTGETLTAADIPDLPGTKIISDLTVNTSGNAATADHAQTADTASSATTAGSADVARSLEIVAEW